ncbi:MAG: hypothetical protein K9J28_04570 [Sulfuritalea sp.]|nr:hypothetical protein [Sulfuritalea sp.]
MKNSQKSYSTGGDYSGMLVLTTLEPFHAFCPTEYKLQKYIIHFPDSYTCNHRCNFVLGETP